ncbi:MAG: NifB/NifX family molybdenum-iron cluster-binding protein [Thermodesulfobacteriota bacterium]|nr:NifB/NifX family molybdenum-iron cluster-binding protein [Thermodesulfobacteriota bacterium]
MKICITSTGPGLDSEMDPRFGRCQYFLFVDLETLGCEAVENPNIGAAGGAGIQSAQLVANKGVEALITGQVGPNAFTTLQAAGIKILTGASGKVREVLDKYQKGQISSSAQGPTVQAHFGMGRGMGRGMGMGRGFPPPPSTPWAAPKEELQALKEQSRLLKDQLDKITHRIEELEKEK